MNHRTHTNSLCAKRRALCVNGSCGCAIRSTIFGRSALTLVEMVMALAIMAIVFAAILPQFRAISNSWDSKQAGAESLQNGRVLIEHLNRNLIKAVRITDVSGSAETNGYIQFEDNDGNTLRYDVNGTTSYVEFGVVGELADLAGPVSQLQFTCYDACDLDNPIDVNDVNSIRFVNVQTTLTNSAALAQDKTFTAQIYLRANNLGLVTIETTTISKETGGSSNFVVSMPSTRPDGDLYIAQIAQEGGAQINSIPSGWTEITDTDMGGSVRLATYWKIGSSEPATYTWGSDTAKKWIGAIHRITGINMSDPINVSGDSTGDSASPTAPSVTTTVNNCLILRMYGSEGNEQASTYWPNGTTGIFQDDSSGVVVSAAAYEYKVSAGSTGTGAFSMTGSKKWVAATVAIAPRILP